MAAILDSPSAERNKEPIWQVLSSNVLPLVKTNSQDKSQVVRVLEVAAGCGVHTQHFVGRFLSSEGEGNIIWFPTDPDVSSRSSIDARVQISNNPDIQRSIQPALPLTLCENGPMEDSASTPLPNGPLDLVVCINMIHISPWSATVGLMQMASERLRKGGVLYCYGPYKEKGTAAPSNLNFDFSLKSRDPSWGVRDLEEVKALAASRGLAFHERVEMPANNLSLIFRKD